MEVCVLGAGIVGLSAAYMLAKAGHTVTVVDRAAAASGASGGNGAQLSYSYVQPLADPALWAQLPKLLLSRSSPLKFRPQIDPQQWKWGMRFLMACNAHRSRTTTGRLLALAAESRVRFDQFREIEGIDCDYSATGKLVLYHSPAAFRRARGQMVLQQQLGGAPQAALSAAETFAVEPALAHLGHGLAGSIYTPSECAADCRKVCEELESTLRARGVRFLLDTPVLGFVRRAEAIVAARTPKGDIAAQAFVLCTGAGSPALARQLGIDLMLYPLKGYSITVDIGVDAKAPRVNITDAARKVVFARIGDRLRVAGMAELVGDDNSIPAARIKTLVDATMAVFPGCSDHARLQPWTGMRPATPTGEPVVGLSEKGPRNLYLNTGHGALGFTLAFGTAHRLVSLLQAS
jgi:D-amino-acid dehydrogenase